MKSQQQQLFARWISQPNVKNSIFVPMIRRSRSLGPTSRHDIARPGSCQARRGNSLGNCRRLIRAIGNKDHSLLIQVIAIANSWGFLNSFVPTGVGAWPTTIDEVEISILIAFSPRSLCLPAFIDTAAAAAAARLIQVKVTCFPPFQKW